MLHDGASLEEVVRLVVGPAHDDAGWHARIMATLAAYPTDKARRKCLEAFLRILEGFRRHGSGWRCVDQSGYVGQQSYPPTPKRVLDPETGEIGESTETERRYVPKDRVRYGLAVRMDRSTRTVTRYKRTLRCGRVFRTQRTTRNMSAIALPHPDAFFGYAQIWLAFPPSAAMAQRFRAWGAPRQRVFWTPHRDADPSCESDYPVVIASDVLT